MIYNGVTAAQEEKWVQEDADGFGQQERVQRLDHSKVSWWVDRGNCKDKEIDRLCGENMQKWVESALIFQARRLRCSDLADLPE